MSFFMGVKHRLRALIFPAAHARDVEEEMRLHLELDAMHQGEAREAALRFGNRTRYREEVRRMTWYGALDVVRQDALYAWRGMLRQPSFTAMVVLTLALGIGVNAATFTVLDMLYFRAPGGIENPGELRRLHVEHFNSRGGEPFISQALSYPMYEELAAAAGGTSAVVLFDTEGMLHLGSSLNDPRVRGVYATANYFRVLGVRPAMGRVYDEGDDRFGSAAPVTVVSHRFWKTMLAGDSAVLGRDINISGTKHRVVGVLDPSFNGTDLQAYDVWIPFSARPAPGWIKGPWWKEPRLMSFRALYRMEPGMSEQGIALRGTQRLRAFNRAAFPDRPDTLTNVMSGAFMEARGPSKPGYQQIISSRLSGVAAIVMLIACANVINLLLSRAVTRRHEFSIRLALGISRSRLVRMLTTETLLLTVIATVPAVLAAWWGGTMLRTLLLPEVQWYEAAITWRVVGFAAGTALLAGLVAGIVPALQSITPDVNHELKIGARTGVAHKSRLRRALVVTQAALSLVLLTGSVLFVRSLDNVRALDIGFDSDRLIFGYVQFDRGAGAPKPVIDAALTDIATRLQGRAGIVSVARSYLEPMQGMTFSDFWTDRDSSRSFRGGTPTVSHVSPGFFGTVGMSVVRGRDFASSASSVGGPLEVVVNEEAARRFWPGEHPLGKCMHIESRNAPCHTVVGVVENAREGKVLEDEPTMQYYLPLGTPGGVKVGETLILRTEGPTALAARELRAEIRAAFPAALPHISTMSENLEPEYRPWRLGASLFTAFGMLALVVALLGIYSTVSYSVAQRTHEFGVRIALGAGLADLVRQVMGEGVRTVLVGIVVGVLLVLAAGQLVASLLYGVSARDPMTVVSVAAVLLAAAAVAAVVPAWRAARVDPLTALRSE